MDTLYDKWKRFQYYCIIGVISVLALFFLPMIGTEVGLAWKIPNTGPGWVVYIVSKLLVATINILIFHCFNLQGKLNSLGNQKYQEAVTILGSVEEKGYTPRSPKEYNSTIYGKKGLIIFTTSVLSAVGLTQAVLTFDWVSMLTYLFTVIMGLIFGVLQMNACEEYWTGEFWLYAKKVQHDLELAKSKCTEQVDDTTDYTGGATFLEPSDCSSSACLTN